MNNIIFQKESFSEALKSHGISAERNKIELLQLNITRKCNQACTHCHVNAGPARNEEMSLNTIRQILRLLEKDDRIKTVDITGGAPELNSNFRYLIRGLRSLNKTIIDRCNLTVLFEKGQEDTPKFLAENGVVIFASLPCYLQKNVDTQRGDATFNKSINGLIKLNQLGYGKKDGNLILNLVHNPTGENLPGDQRELEEEYKYILTRDYGIVFNHLYTIANMPISRYCDKLKREGEYEKYLSLLVKHFNYSVADRIMCKKQISVGWDGRLYDCDFNQALGEPISSKKNSIWDIESFSEVGKAITYDVHCFGCTAGCGSSCQGKLN